VLQPVLLATPKRPKAGAEPEERPAQQTFWKGGYVSRHPNPGSARGSRAGECVHAFANFRFLFITLQLITSSLCWACFNHNAIDYLNLTTY
jgi:hypothetical protein